MFLSSIARRVEEKNSSLIKNHYLVIKGVRVDFFSQFFFVRCSQLIFCIAVFWLFHTPPYLLSVYSFLFFLYMSKERIKKQGKSSCRNRNREKISISQQFTIRIHLIDHSTIIFLYIIWWGLIFLFSFYRKPIFFASFFSSYINAHN